MKKKFKRVYLEITNICNLSCSFCPGTSRRAEYMSQELFEEILANLVGYTDYLYFHVMGEPLLHPQIGDFLDICDEYGYQVNLTTNGMFLKETAAQLLNKPALRQVNISLHSQESLAEGDQYLEHIFAFTKAFTNYISLRLWNLATDVSNHYLLQRIEKEFGITYNIIDHIQPGVGLRLQEKVFLNPETQFEWPTLAGEKLPGPAYCYGLNSQIAILVDGTVVPCCLDGEGIIALGNLKQQTFEEIVSSIRVKMIRDGFSQGKAVEELCQKCSYRTRFTKTNK